MKAWAFIIIVLSLCGKLMKHFLPRGEKSPLYSSLRFLLSLCLIVALVSPLIHPSGLKTEFFSMDGTDGTETDGNAVILEKMGKTIKKSVDTAFPECEYSLEIFADEQGIPVEIRVIDGGEQAAEISDFIRLNYGLKTSSS